MDKRAGFIYGLYTLDDGKIFYVGRTQSLSDRIYRHRLAAPTGHEAKYEYIRTLGDRQWDIIELDTYTAEEGYINKEDDTILTLLVAGETLQNMIKGSAAWKERYETRINEMTKLGFTSAKKYKEYKEGENMKLALERNQQRICEELDPILLHHNAENRRTTFEEMKQRKKQEAEERKRLKEIKQQKLDDYKRKCEETRQYLNSRTLSEPKHVVQTTQPVWTLLKKYK
jgi:hypothetical protein